MTGNATAALALHDGRPFFDKVLAHGVQRGILDAERLAAIHTDAPKGIVQIARYFGSEFLRPELEKARDRMVNLISLNLLEASGGDLDQAAVLLRDNSLLSRSKGGSDMLRRMIAMPESSNFGLVAHTDAEVPQLALWSLRSHAEYRSELARRSQAAQAIAAAEWVAGQYGLDTDELEAAGADAEAVVRTGLLLQAVAPAAMDDWPSTAGFTQLVMARRKKKSALPETLPMPPGLPAALRGAVEPLADAVLADLRRLLAPSTNLRTLLRPMGSFRARYFLLDDPLAEVDDYHRGLDDLAPDGDDAEPPRPASKTWVRAVQGHDDEHSLLTLFVCLAAGVPKKTLLTEKTAASLVRKVRKSGWQPSLAEDFIRTQGPGVHEEDYLALWRSFVQEAEKTLLSDMDYQLRDALALLRRECSVAEG